MTLNPLNALLLAAALLPSGASTAAAQQAASESATGSLLNIDRLRAVSRMLPGSHALRINVLKFAESRRTKNFSIKGAPAAPSIQARTAFQVVYPDGYIMIDSGMDQQVHKFFGRGTEEPYDSAANQEIQRALRGARSIVMTHEHGDHIAGVLRSDYLDEIASKTVLTRTQVQTLLNTPQMPEIKITPEQAKRYIVIDYESYAPFAPGISLMKAAGHTSGSQMIYVALANGEEYLFIGDSAWHMDGVRLMRGKDANWIKEDEDALAAQLKWLNMLDRTEKNLHIVVSHDDEQRKDYIQRGLLGGKLE